MPCWVGEGGLGGQILSLKSAYISNLSLLLGLKSFKKFIWVVFCPFYTSPVVAVVVVVIGLESDFIANSAKLYLD